MSDLIDRQAAIDEIKALYEWHDTVTEDRTIDHLKRLPSAQPEIIRCGECRYYRECEIFGKKITLCKRREYDSMYTEPDDFCSRGARREK